jgi:hypothetical protein
MEDIDALIDGITPVQASVDLCLRGELYAELDRLVDELERLSEWKPGEGDGLAPVDPRNALREQINNLREEMLGSSKRFVFQAIGDKDASDILANHPAPKNEQGEPVYPGYDWHPQTYPVAIVAAASLDPKLTEAQAGRLFDKLNLDQRNEMFAGALRAMSRRLDIPFFEAASEKAAETE